VGNLRATKRIRRLEKTVMSFANLEEAPWMINGYYHGNRSRLMKSIITQAAKIAEEGEHLMEGE